MTLPAEAGDILCVVINHGKSQKERMKLLHELAVQQMTTLSSLELNNLPKLNQNE